jgi:hypothetical protein
MHIKLYSEALNERDHVEDLGVRERIILNWMLKRE